MRQLDARRVARCRIAVQHERRPRLQHRQSPVERSDPQLGALKVAQDGRRTAEFLFQCPDRRYAGGMILMRAPATNSARIISGLSLAGPRVAKMRTLRERGGNLVIPLVS